MRKAGAVRYLSLCVASFLVCGRPCPAQSVDASSVDGKVLVGYQGWFRCPGDGSPGGNWGTPDGKWNHWFHHGLPDSAATNPATRVWDVDLYPDVSDLDKSSLCPVPGLQINGKQAYLFTSFAKATMETHFGWMRQYGIDGALVQRFVTNLPQFKAERERVLKNEIAGAEDNGRVFAVEYDMTGAETPDGIAKLKADWIYLTRDLKVTESKAYLRDKGKPLVSIWGLGQPEANRIHDPVVAKQLIDWFKTEGNATVMGGVPTGWGSLSLDTQTDPGWAAVFQDLDIVQPWQVGRSYDVRTANRLKETRLVPDIEMTQRNHQEYMPVIFPGFSWHARHTEGKSNAIPRLGGTFLWTQAVNAKLAGAKMVKIAMFDELNEGTAILKTVNSRDAVPADGEWVTLDIDGYALPSDWYLQVAGQVGKLFHNQAPAAAALPLPLTKISAR